MKKKKAWFVYIVRAVDGTLYTGIARDVDKRLEKHRSGTGSRYLRGRGPLKVVYHETLPGMSQALKREVRIKRFTRKKKLGLIAGTREKRVFLRPSPPVLKGLRRAGS